MKMVYIFAPSKLSDLWVSYAMSDEERHYGFILVDRLKKRLQLRFPVIYWMKQQEELVSTLSTYKYMVDHMRSCADGKEDLFVAGL